MWEDLKIWLFFGTIVGAVVGEVYYQNNHPTAEAMLARVQEEKNYCHNLRSGFDEIKPTVLEGSLKQDVERCKVIKAWPEPTPK